MSHVAVSQNGVLIRLSDEQLQHLVERHHILSDKKSMILNKISHSTHILQGNEGFIITAFPTRRINSLNRRQQIWP
jgi:hypothetical protein